MSAANSIYFPKAIGAEKNLLNMMCNMAFRVLVALKMLSLDGVTFASLLYTVL